MEESSRDIQRLIKLKKQRPAFARMISWEMNQSADTENGKKGIPKKKRKRREGGDMQTLVDDENDVDEDIDCQSAGSSDYETANEEVIDELELSTAFSSINTEASFDTADIAIEDDLDTDDDDVDNEDELEQCVPTDCASGGLQPGRRRRPSKRQKRKKRNLYKVTYMEEFLNLGNLFDMTNDIEAVFTETSEAIDTVEVSSRVPTLAELCLQATKRRRHRNKSGPKPNVVRPAVLPYGIKRIIADWRFHQRMLERQLSFLQNFVLPSLCHKDGVNKCLIYYDTSDETTEIRFPVRSVWSAYAITVDDDSGVQYPSSRATAYLYIPTMRPLSDDIRNSISNYRQLQYLESSNVSSTHNLSALATTIDLMLPSTLTERSRSRSSSTDTDADAIASASKTLISRVKNALRSRYPYLIDDLFDRVIPYVMWARGNIGQATQMFQALIEKETIDLFKAMYLSEIAVMHSMFGDGQTAATFYKLASEVALTNESGAEAIKEATEQTQVLLASIHDCGLMTAEKAQAALVHWSNAVKLASPNTAAVLGAADSFLCNHLTQLTADDCWKQAEDRLRAWASSNKYLGYFISLLLALRGKDLDSTTAFREFRHNCGLRLPGEMIFKFLEKSERKNPWNPLIKIVKNQREPVKPLKVVWRTQLRPPRLTNNRPMETDLCSHDLSLRISESGHLTGDMQMLMPPIREVALDLHAGSLVLNYTPSYTGTWKATDICIDDLKGVDFMLPTPCQIYSHDDGTSVHLMSPNLSSCHGKNDSYLPVCPMVLTWKGPDGQTAKINPIIVLKMAERKKVDNLTLEKLPHGRTEEKLEVVKALVDIAFNKNLSLNVQHLYSAATTIINYNKKAVKKAAKKRKEHEQKEQISKESQIRAVIPKDLNKLLQRFSVTLEGEPLQYGRAVVINLNMRSSDRKYCLVLDTSSREAFLNYKLIPMGKVDQEVNRRQLGSNACNDKFFVFRICDQVSICNEKGETVSCLDIGALSRDEHPNGNVNLCIIGDYLFGVNKTRLSIWKHIIGLEIEDCDFDMMSVLSLAPYWELEDERKQIDNVLALGTEVKGKGRFLFVHLSVGLGLMDPDTTEMIPISLPENCDLMLTEDGNVILAQLGDCELLAEKSFVEEQTAVYRFAIGTENKLFLFNVSHTVGSDQLQASLLHYFFLPGEVKEACIVGKEVGLLVSLTQHEEQDNNYREHVFHFRNDGLLYGVLLCLRQGPHSFCPVYIGEAADSSNGPGWYVYMRDGRDGILGVKLFE